MIFNDVSPQEKGMGLLDGIDLSWRELRPAKFDKLGPAYSPEDVLKCVAKAIESEQYFERRFKVMSKEIVNCAKLTDEATEQLGKSVDALLAKEALFFKNATTVAREIKNASENIGQGIARVEKAANFDRLERYVGLLERAASAMQTLAVLQDSGKLDKIAGALK